MLKFNNLSLRRRGFSNKTLLLLIATICSKAYLKRFFLFNNFPLYVSHLKSQNHHNVITIFLSSYYLYFESAYRFYLSIGLLTVTNKTIIKVSKSKFRSQKIKSKIWTGWVFFWQINGNPFIWIFSFYIPEFLALQ